MKRLLVALVLVASVSVAGAKPRKFSTAYAASGIGTGVSVVLIAGAFAFPPHSGDIWYPMLYTGIATGVLTPSLGNLYAEHWLNVGMGIRIAAGAFGVYAAKHYQQDKRCDTNEPKTCQELSGTGVTMIALAGIVFIGGAAYDFKSIRDDVDDYNAHHRFNWAPILAPSPTGSGAVLGVGGSF